LGRQEPGRGEGVNNILDSSPMVLRAAGFGVPRHLVAVGRQVGDREFNTTRFYTKIGAGEVVGQDGWERQVSRFLQAALIRFR
jgi:hypothetical protein